MEAPRTRYARLGDSHIAYQVFGSGPPLLLMLGLLTHVEVMWEEPGLARFLRRLASFSTTLVFDKRGSGLSDPDGAITTLESFADDASAALDAAGLGEAIVVACNEASFVGISLAATQPARVRGLVVVNGTARTLRGRDYPIGVDPEEAARYIERGREGYADQPVGLRLVAPSKVGDPVFEAWARRFQRASASPGGLQQAARLVGTTDVRAALPAVHCPALVLHTVDNRFLPVAHGRYLADHLPVARLVELRGADHTPWVGTDTSMMLDEIEVFATGSEPTGTVDRVLATIMFTDIVGSTEQLTRLGDRAWSELVDTHDLTVGQVVDRHNGRIVDTAGDGVFAIFDGPSRALDAARLIQDRLGEVGLRLRAGVHTGEVELDGAAVRGLAVHTAARIMAAAEGGQILASRTVRDLSAGSGHRFVLVGSPMLKGLPEAVDLFAVDPPEVPET